MLQEFQEVFFFNIVTLLGSCNFCQHFIYFFLINYKIATEAVFNSKLGISSEKILVKFSKEGGEIFVEEFMAEFVHIYRRNGCILFYWRILQIFCTISEKWVNLMVLLSNYKFNILNCGVKFYFIFCTCSEEFWRINADFFNSD